MKAWAVMKAWLALWSAAQPRGMDNRGPSGNDGRDLSSASDDAWHWRIEEAIAGPISREVWGNAELSKADQGGAEVRPPARTLSWKASRRPTVSSRKTTGDKRSDWTRHSVYWAIALVVVILIAIAGLLSTLRKWEQLGMARVTSRCLEIFNGWG